MILWERYHLKVVWRCVYVCLVSEPPHILTWPQEVERAPWSYRTAIKYLKLSYCNQKSNITRRRSDGYNNQDCSLVILVALYLLHSKWGMEMFTNCESTCSPSWLEQASLSTLLTSEPISLPYSFTEQQRRRTSYQMGSKSVENTEPLQDSKVHVQN